MPSYMYILTVLGLASIGYAIHTYRCFAKNIAAAKGSGLPYILSPISTWHPFTVLTSRLWRPYLSKLPETWTRPWLGFLSIDFAWEKLYDPFRALDSDAFLVVSPGSIDLVVADPNLINQITSRRNDFPKPTDFYKGINIFGRNVVSAEGNLWRHHRKVTSPSFNEKNNRLVWRESLRQAQSMMRLWAGPNSDDTGRLKDVAEHTMRLALHVISRAGFGVGLKWPHEQEKGDDEIPEGHSMTYKDALSTLLDYTFVVVGLPHWFLRNSPFSKLRVAHESFVEWGKYMRELFEQKRHQIQSGDTDEGMDLMDALVKGAGVRNDNEDSKDENSTKQLLEEDEVFGNMYVVIIAGHETSANVLHFSMVLLAMQTESQRHLQADLDDILGDKPIADWDYETDMPKMFGSMVGAVMNEELRLVPSVTVIFKTTHKPQILQMGDKQITVPAGATVAIDAAAVHYNPKYWPHTSEQDLVEFRPERWLLDPSKQNTNIDEDAYAHEEGLEFDETDKRPDTAASLFRPHKASYVPFSEGYRSCLGRRFAQVEIMAVLATVFKTWSVELDVSDYLSDEEFEKASEEEKRAAWRKAEEKARHLLREGMTTMITLQMKKEKVPLRFVKRGKERFAFMKNDAQH